MRGSRKWLIVIGLGVALLLAGILGARFSAGTNLTPLVVPNPAHGMVATAEGSGGSSPTNLLPGSKKGVGIEGSKSIPTTPTLFLGQATMTNFGVNTGNESAYWKVWWDGGVQEKDVVSLQQHLDSSDANAQVAILGSLNNRTSHFNNATLRFTNLSEFAIPGIPGSRGHLWKGVEDGKLQIMFRFVVFARGSVVALLSTTGYGRTPGAATFQAFAQLQYKHMATTPDPLFMRLLFESLAGLGLIVLIIGIVFFLVTRRRPAVMAKAAASGPSPIQTGWSPPSTVGGLQKGWVAPAGITPPATPNPTGAASNAPARPGWYPDPTAGKPGIMRYWDGNQWTGATSGRQ